MVTIVWIALNVQCNFTNVYMGPISMFGFESSEGVFFLLFVFEK